MDPTEGIVGLKTQGRQMKQSRQGLHKIWIHQTQPQHCSSSTTAMISIYNLNTCIMHHAKAQWDILPYCQGTSHRQLWKLILVVMLLGVSAISVSDCCLTPQLANWLV